MPHRTLADLLEELGRAGELAPVDAEVDSRGEVAEITRRIARQAGPALLFRNVQGHEIPLLTNLLATEARICRALGVETIEEVIGRIDRMLNSSGGEGWLERLRFGASSSANASFAANRVKSGACQQIVRLGRDVNLEDFPFLQHSPQMGAESEPPTISAATILSAQPDSHAQVFLNGDVEVSGRDRLIAVWSDVASALPLIQEYAARQARMPVAIVLGGDPAMQLAAASPLPADTNPLGLAGLLREKPLDAVPCRSVDLLAPAEADIIIEGQIDPAEDEARTAPRLSPTGRILAALAGHTIHVTAVTHRANRILPAVVPGIDCNENCIRDRTMARVFLPFLKTRIPELVDFDLPLAAGARHLAILAIRKSYAGQARQVAMRAWGMRPFGFARLLVVVDAAIDVRDAEQVWAAIVHETHLVHDVWNAAFTRDPLDPTSSMDAIGPGRAGTELVSNRMAIDATPKLALEGRGSRARNASLDREIEKLVTERWAQYGLGPEK
jgi:4-hydroxy-3-polyprenylbenzoate decarboxylase